MSTIFDALKRSERDRTLVRGPGFGDAGRRLPRDYAWLPWLIGTTVLVAAAIFVTVFVLRGRMLPVEVADLAAPGTSTPTPVGNPPVSKPASIPASTTTGADKSASELPALQDAAVAAAPRPMALLPPDGEARLLSAMPPAFQQSVPPMAVNIHVYAPEESQRILYINNHQYYRGDEIPGGVLVEEIVSDGVVLQFQGQRFRLPRPS